jgi:hypothetical protein
MPVVTACVHSMFHTRISRQIERHSDPEIYGDRLYTVIRITNLVRSLNISSTERRGEVVLCIREIPGSNLGSETRYFD